MDFDEEDDEIMLWLLVASGTTNLLSIQPKSELQLVWVKPWLQKSTKSAHHNIISELKPEGHCDD